jgi:hypothetical protein
MTVGDTAAAVFLLRSMPAFFHAGVPRRDGTRTTRKEHQRAACRRSTAQRGGGEAEGVRHLSTVNHARCRSRRRPWVSRIRPESPGDGDSMAERGGRGRGRRRPYARFMVALIDSFGGDGRDDVPELSH